LRLERELLQDKDYRDRESIITTFINKAAILSALRRFKQAVECLKEASGLILEPTDPEAARTNTYLKCLLTYNIGVEYENMALKETAGKYYRSGLKKAREIANLYLESKCLQALGSK
jgi:tetratricopeptide (TPR) repeat protein